MQRFFRFPSGLAQAHRGRPVTPEWLWTGWGWAAYTLGLSQPAPAQGTSPALQKQSSLLLLQTNKNPAGSGRVGRTIHSCKMTRHNVDKRVYHVCVICEPSSHVCPACPAAPLPLYAQLLAPPPHDSTRLLKLPIRIQNVVRHSC
jgi:hypothetical protein